MKAMLLKDGIWWWFAGLSDNGRAFLIGRGLSKNLARKSTSGRGSTTITSPEGVRRVVMTKLPDKANIPGVIVEAMCDHLLIAMPANDPPPAPYVL